MSAQESRRYEGLPGAWAEFEAWIAASGHKTASDLWEVHTVGPESSSNPDDWRTELNRPLRDQNVEMDLAPRMPQTAPD